MALCYRAAEARDAAADVAEGLETNLKEGDEADFDRCVQNLALKSPCNHHRLPGRLLR